MNNYRYRMVMLSILLSLIVICMGVLSLLSFATSLAQERQAQRYSQTVRIRYELEEEGRRYLMENRGAPVDTVIEKEGYRLILKAGNENGNTLTEVFSIGKIWEEKDSIDDLWGGN